LIVLVSPDGENGILGKAAIYPDLFGDVKLLIVARKVSVASISYLHG